MIGEREPLKAAVVASIGKALELIDLNVHTGQHPRMGAVDVVPFIPLRGATMEEADALAKEVAREAAEKYSRRCSFMNSPRRHRTESILPMCARGSLRVWQRR